jgi:hypothetical protein
LRNIIDKIRYSIDKFELDLSDLTVLTEAATGNYVVTPILAALAGAQVIAFTKNSEHGDVQNVIDQTFDLSDKLKVTSKIDIIQSLGEIDLSQVDVITNTGFLRPINETIISRLSSSCVIPLMWEPWEYRPAELDLQVCAKKGVKVYGTNESDPRLRTMEYIGYVVLHFLLKERCSPFSSKVLILGDGKFGKAIKAVLDANEYSLKWVSDYDQKVDNIDQYDVIICAEHQNKAKLIGGNGYLNGTEISPETIIIHIAGSIDSEFLKSKVIPEQPQKYGHMSYTADFIDNLAIIDLHTAGLNVAQGMIEANKLQLSKSDYKYYLESNYPALAFGNEEFW